MRVSAQASTALGLVLLGRVAHGLNSTDLMNALLPGSTAALAGETITGETKDFGQLAVTLLSNSTHALSQ